MTEQEIKAALKTWREGLIGLTRANRLIKFNAPRTSSLLLDSPQPDEILSKAESGRPQAFRGQRNTAGDGGLGANQSTAVAPAFERGDASRYLHSPRPDSELGPVLRNLMRRATEEYLDRGLSVLYLAFGILDWKDVDGTQMSSPLLLVPVTLQPEGPKGTPRLVGGEDDAVVNPALALRLQDFNIDLPSMDELDVLSVTEVLARARGALEASKDFSDWDLRPAVYLSTFSFSKEAMFKDLKDHEDTILEHPIVRALATSDPTKQIGDFQFDPIDPDDIDTIAPPEDTPLVLDADSSQRRAVAAALAGKTFVMDGPPGTGKSQTIANMIGALLHSGRTVLFVSEKIAALDVVRNRLADAGLANYLLELHSHKSSRREVAAELLRSLDNVTQPPASMETLGRSAVRDRRIMLNEYAEATNELRQPLGMSLHHVLGLLANLTDVPSAPVPEVSPMELGQAEYFSIRERAADLVRAWRPAAQGESFLWRDVVDHTSLDIRLYNAETALDRLRGNVELNDALADAFEWTHPSDTPRIVALTSHQHRGAGLVVPERWLITEDWSAVNSARTALGDQIAAVLAAEAEVQEAAGLAWDVIPEGDSLPAEPAPVSALPSPVEISGLRATDLLDTADRFQVEGNLLTERAMALSGLAHSWGLSPVETFADVDRVCALVDIRSRRLQLERRWFSPEGLGVARTSTALLREQIGALASAESMAEVRFTQDALQVPLAELQDRFTNLHKGLRKLSGQYRADKRTVGGLLTSAGNVKEGISHLADAIAWVDTTRSYGTTVVQQSDALGRHWNERDTNFERLGEALATVEEILGLVEHPVPHALINYLCGTDDNQGLQSLVDAARHDLMGWKAELAPRPALRGRPELLAEPVTAATAWLDAHVVPMRQAAARIEAMEAVTGSRHTLREVEDLLALVATVHHVRDTLDSESPTHRAQFDSHYIGANTNLADLDTALTWAEKLRLLAGGALSAGQVKELQSAPLVEPMSTAYDKWVEACESVVAAFAPSRHQELARELDDYRNAPDLLADLRADTVGQQEWFAYQTARRDLAERGLGPAIDFCIERHIAADQVPPALDRALLRAWADAVIYDDPRLRPLLAKDREALVAEYRKLDLDLIVGATSEIIRATNTRRPVNSAIGEPAVIRREGAKQRRHIPVRDLIARARNTAQAIKPVLMMSPLAVSQYLPSDMKFDVVIFDEASQVTPGDAINCIYRGDSLILAGDDKQLPPTSFFERNTEGAQTDDTDVDDFQSVLELAKACGAFNNLGLRWHYRSRHEALIAYSNYKFYEGNLITYPSAHAEGEHVGIEFYKTHGMYRRGGGADNPGEARKVAERVIEHYSQRPELTLGVVTFSVAQADAVVAALSEAREGRRDLDRFFDTEDRLNGFFVRSLESVQGDERDVIIFSVGYGPDEAGKISTNFGVLNRDKGWRRLNVGVTRARQRVEVVASMRAGDIPPSTNENVEYLRSYLDYADRGMQILAVPYSTTGLGPESPFEESVIDAIRGWGYQVEPQVGAAGFRIDIGVRHPAHPGMFALAVECDGYQYHSAPAARDRDRLRDQILVGLGWRLHRIWGTSWYRDRTIEEARLKGVIEEAIATPIDGRVTLAPPLERPEITTVTAEFSSVPTWVSEYETAQPVALPYWVQPGEPGNSLHMIDALVGIATTEGPVHLDLVYERLRGWWDIGRISYRIRENIDLAVVRAPILREGDFLDVPDRRVDRVRVPSLLVNRKAEQVHTDELALAAELLVRDVGGAARPEVTQQVARIFGWNRTGANVDRLISEAIDRRVRAGALREADGNLTIPSANT